MGPDNVFHMHASSKFVCPGTDRPCPIRARIRDFGSCAIRVFTLDTPYHDPVVKGEYLVTECAECPYNMVAQRVIRELLHPSAAPKSYPTRKEGLFYPRHDCDDGY
jgi:hypothetical protein